jgi:hypothetical protein
MAVTSDKAAPYATASSILDIIGRYRSRGLPSPVTGEVLGRAGIPDSLVPRTLQSLQTLDLIDDSGQPTATMESIRKAPESDYKQRLVQWLNGAYADVLNFIDPATADEIAVRDAFRNYIPVGQQPRMVSLFIALYAAAGIGPERPATPRQQRAPQTARARPISKSGSGSRATSHVKPTITQNINGIPEPLTGLLSRLPSDRGWTQTDRDKFLSTFGTVLDFCFPIVTQDALDAETVADDE